MKRERKELRQPYGRGDYELHRDGRGVYWQAGDGLTVRLAAPDREAGAASSAPVTATALQAAGLWGTRRLR
jgi:hypothetical protein